MRNTRSLTPEQRFELVMECRSSGLTDYQWCKEHDIHPGTFYNWIARFESRVILTYPHQREGIQSIRLLSKKL